MAEHPEVFISATTRDLGNYRREIKDALLSLQIFPIEESSFTLAYGPLVAMLRDLIGRCDAVIHLAGFSYGAEPPPPGQRRRSYTQIEYDVALELKKPLYRFLATENYEPDELSTQSDEERNFSLLTGALLSSAATFITSYQINGSKMVPPHPGRLNLHFRTKTERMSSTVRG